MTFANIRVYLQAMGFDKVHDENSFRFKQRTRCGAYDEALFAFHLQDDRNVASPFFRAVMSSTRHEPFDVPVDEDIPGKDQPQQYRNSVHYTDRTLAASMRAGNNREQEHAFPSSLRTTTISCRTTVEVSQRHDTGSRSCSPAELCAMIFAESRTRLSDGNN